MKVKTCRHCGKPFTPAKPLQIVCGWKCANAYVRGTERARREALKPLRKVASEAQRVFNAYIRARDHGLPCISCGRHHKGAWDAGHYLSVGARPDLRFDESNVHRQCVPCNQHKAGNAVAYRLGLIARIGEAEVARLEGPPTRGKYTREELAGIKVTYAAKRRRLIPKGDEA